MNEDHKFSFYEDFFIKLGKIIVNYNLIESNIIGLICNLVNHNDITVGFLKCKRKGAMQLLELLKEEVKAKILEVNILYQFDTLYNHLKDVINIRNGYLHSIYLDSENKEFILNENTNFISQIKIREFEKGNTTINSGLIYSLEGMDNFNKILNDVWEESNKFFRDISNVTPVRRINYIFPDIPKNLK
jgi:hypothetical protein